MRWTPERIGTQPDVTMLWLQRTAGNAATSRLLPRGGGARVQRAPVAPAPAAGVTAPSAPPPATTTAEQPGVAFVREEGLNLRAGPDQSSGSLAQLAFGTRVHLLADEAPHAGWQKVATPAAAVGYLYAPRVHRPPPDLIARDPGLSMVRVRSGQTFWGLVKEQYGIQGNESTADQNINHFINAIRAVNKGDAFIVQTDWLDDIGNWLLSGRDASDTLLKTGYDLWIPSFGVAAAMDVGSGTVTGEVARIVKKIEQKIQDFKTACAMALKYIPDAVVRRAGDTATGLLAGLIDFALDAAKILGVTTAVGALIGALFGGVGAVPGAEIGFEIGLLILKYYGLAMLIEAVLGMAGSLVSALGSFISQVWNANGDPKQLDAAGATLADALGIMVSAVLIVLAAYVMKKGGEAFSRTTFATKVGQSNLARWMADRQKMKTLSEKRAAPKTFQRTQAELDDLARDPAHGNKVTPKGIRERQAGLDLEARGDIPGPIRRDPNPAGAEFIDAAGVKWDVKAFNSNFPPKKGGFSVADAERKILKELSKNENVILDTKDLSAAHVQQLQQLVVDKGWASRIRWWP